MQVRLIGYFSTKATSPSARSRHGVAKKAFDQAKLPTAEGGLGMVVGFRDVENTDTWKDFISNCPEGEAEAESYLPLLRRGVVVLVITDVNEKEWTFGPGVMNGTMDGFLQVSTMRTEHERLNPQRYAARDARPTAVVADATSASGGQR